MSQQICLDGANLTFDVDAIEVALDITGLERISPEDVSWSRCEGGEAMEPVASYQGGTTLFYHCPPEGETGAPGYRVESPRPHHWVMQVEEHVGREPKVKVARFHVELD